MRMLTALLLLGIVATGTAQDMIQSFQDMPEKEQREWVFEYLEDNPEGVDVLRELMKMELLDPGMMSPSGKESLFTLFLTQKDTTSLFMLLEMGYKVNSRYIKRESETPMHEVIASELDSISCTRVLEKLTLLGANPDLRDLKSYTPVHYAISNQNVPALHFFLRDNIRFETKIVDLDERTYLDYYDKKWKSEVNLREQWRERLDLPEPESTPKKKDKPDKKSKKKKGN